jgi:hypothetical protein
MGVCLLCLPTFLIAFHHQSDLLSCLFSLKSCAIPDRTGRLHRLCTVDIDLKNSSISEHGQLRRTGIVISRVVPDDTLTNRCFYTE